MREILKYLSPKGQYQHFHWVTHYNVHIVTGVNTFGALGWSLYWFLVAVTDPVYRRVVVHSSFLVNVSVCRHIVFSGVKLGYDFWKTSAWHVKYWQKFRDKISPLLNTESSPYPFMSLTIGAFTVINSRQGQANDKWNTYYHSNLVVCSTVLAITSSLGFVTSLTSRKNA